MDARIYYYFFNRHLSQIIYLSPDLPFCYRSAANEQSEIARDALSLH